MPALRELARDQRSVWRSMSYQVLIFLTVVLAAAAAWEIRFEDSRRRRLRRLAETIGATFHLRDVGHWGVRLNELSLWQYGHAHRLSHVLQGTAGSISYLCFSGSFDVGFGRDRCHRTHVVVVFETGRELTGLVCAREANFIPCGAHARFVPWPRQDDEQAVVPDGDGWQLWTEPGDDPREVWSRLQPACRDLASPCLIEARENLLMICRPGRTRPKDYRLLIEAGLKPAQALVGDGAPA